MPPALKKTPAPGESAKPSRPAVNRWSLAEAATLVESAESVWKAAVVVGVLAILTLILACALGMSTILFILGGAGLALGCWLGTMSQLLHIRATNLRLIEQTKK
jgi:membrane-associated phospholipid phosphatase